MLEVLSALTSGRSNVITLTLRILGSRSFVKVRSCYKHAGQEPRVVNIYMCRSHAYKVLSARMFYVVLVFSSIGALFRLSM